MVTPLELILMKITLVSKRLQRVLQTCEENMHVEPTVRYLLLVE